MIIIIMVMMIYDNDDDDDDEHEKRNYEFLRMSSWRALKPLENGAT